MHIEIRRGSLLDQVDVEVIVNAANSSMRGGGGIDGAIHRAAGPKLLDELIQVAPKGCAPGDVIVTSAFELPFRYIFHTPGPIWRGGGSGEAEVLASCYRRCLEEAHRREIGSIGFCSIATGVFGYPLHLAAPIAIRTVLTEAKIQKVVFAMFAKDEYGEFQRVLARASQK